MKVFIGIVATIIVIIVIINKKRKNTRKNNTKYHVETPVSNSDYKFRLPSWTSTFHIGKSVSNSYYSILHEVTTENRGTDFEKDLIVYLLKSGISPKVIFHDLYVPTFEGKYAQIDLVVVTSEGIIVIEVKDYGGWIFGSGKQQQWTQVLAYGREKHRFYNPILQNANHINALKRQTLQFSKLPYFSVIVFSNYCELKELSIIPKDTFVTKGKRIVDVINHIKESYPTANYTDKYEVVNILQKAVNNGISTDTQKQHIENIHDMLGKDRIFD